MIITSPHNPRIKQVLALRDRKERDRSGLTRVEGYDELLLALASGVTPQALFFCPALFPATDQAALLERLGHSGVELVEVSERVFEKIAYREGPDGWLALFRSPARPLDALPLGARPLVIVAEAVEKPGNLGAILRTADAAGVDAVVAAAPLTDWGNPNVVRSSKGALFSVPVAAASNQQTAEWLRRRGLRIVTATPEAELVYTQVDLRGPLAVVVGTEKHGLSPAWRAEQSQAVRIPMVGRVNSLNVATATALLVYEAVRQRSSSA